MDELTQEFLAESLEGLDRMDRCLTELESRPADADLLSEIFRAVHTIKGTTGFLGFNRLEKLAHAGETLLGALRDGHLQATPELISGLLQLMDGLRAILLLIEKLGHEGDRAQDDDHDLIKLMEQLASGESSEPVKAAVTAEPGPIPATAEKTIRVDVDVLNRMVNLVGELVLTRNQMLQSSVDAGSFPELARRLDSVTGDLRETVMQARMQPVGHLFSKFPRMVRDLARSCGKSVRIEFSGQETGLDKSLLEAIKDPLTHALRNAVDHGIELPPQRTLAGKPVEGTIRMRARHQGGSVLIEVQDDGAGISAERVCQKAIERGLITPEQARKLTERELQQLIFLPGFSTAAQLSMVSGRGVGMDVVKSNVEGVGGTVEMESLPGEGTLLRLRLPLTLAIVPALVVRSGGQSFCLPQASLAELVCVMSHEAEGAVQRIGSAELYRLRERLLPMVWLDSLLGLEADRAASCANGFYLAVLEAQGCRFGLVIDELMAPEEIVVKPLSAALRQIGLFSGATVLGNGTLAMILDAAAVAARAGVHAQAEDARAQIQLSPQPPDNQEQFLVFESCDSPEGAERTAIPLRAVERIELIARSSIEYAGGKPLLQYRGELLSLSQPFDGRAEELTVLICREGGRRTGIVVHQVLTVSPGSLLRAQSGVSELRLALVHDRLAAVCEAFPESEFQLRQVA